jgi:sRNA-binding regulator protein Hfq
MKSTVEEERANQLAVGRLLAKENDAYTVKRVSTKKVFVNKDKLSSEPTRTQHAPGFKAKGHDAVIKAGQDRGSNVNFVFTDGSLATGVIVARDRYTISAKLDGNDRATVIYKHAIQSFTVMGDK